MKSPFFAEQSRDFLRPRPTWWLIPLSKWVITPVISGLTLLIHVNHWGYNPLTIRGMSHQVPPFISIGAEKDHEEHPNEAASTGGPRGFEASKGRPLQGVFWEGKLHGCWPAKDAMENVHFLFHINFQRHVRDWKFECLVKKNGCKCAVLMRCKYECSHHFGRMCLSVWVRVELCENSLYGSFFQV